MKNEICKKLGIVGFKCTEKDKHVDGLREGCKTDAVQGDDPA